jgi:hypothetical protein
VAEHLGPEFRHTSMQFHGGAYCSQLVVFMTGWNAEQSDDLFIECVIDQPAMLSNHIDRAVADSRH